MLASKLQQRKVFQLSRTMRFCISKTKIKSFVCLMPNAIKLLDFGVTKISFPRFQVPIKQF